MNSNGVSKNVKACVMNNESVIYIKFHFSFLKITIFA
jgi:hypothetical protein